MLRCFCYSWRLFRGGGGISSALGEELGWNELEGLSLFLFFLSHSGTLLFRFLQFDLSCNEAQNFDVVLRYNLLFFVVIRLRIFDCFHISSLGFLLLPRGVLLRE